MTPTRTIFLHIPAWEQALFYVIIAGSLLAMAWQIAARVRLWKTGRPVAPNREGWRYWLPTRDALGRWMGRLGTYVLAQKKVRSSRKRTGAPMHLLIFYGFLSLFLATSLLAVAKYGPWNFHRGTYYVVYETTFDLLGLLFVAGIAWALIRRLLEANRGAKSVALAREKEDPAFANQLAQNRRHPLSHTLSDTAALALLLVVGLSGYWLEAARISNVPQTWDTASVVGYAWAQAQGPVGDGLYRFVWWFHTFWIAVFFAVLPRMRIRHLVMAILSTAGKPETPVGKLRTIPMEEVEETGQIGVAHARDYSRWHLMSLDACMECGRCTEVCPAWNVGKVLNPKQVVQDVRDAMATGQPVAERVTEEALWQCTTCNACVEACPVLIRHVDLIVDARRHLVAEGKLSGSGATMLRQVTSTGHAWGRPAIDREDWMKGLEVPLCRDGVEFEFLFWVGCAGATDSGAMKTTRAVAELLTKAGVKFACLGKEEACTGDPARRLGDEFLFQEHAGKNASVFAKYGVKKVVTACPHCFNSLKHEYGDFEASMEVWHHSQLLAQLVDQGKLVAATVGSNVTFHDPCYLSRVNDDPNSPRRTLGPGLKEPDPHGVKTRCCGAGGGRMWFDEPPTERPSNARVDQLLATGAKTIALGCPFCRIMLDAGVKSVTDEEIRLVDLAELLQEKNRS